MSRDLLYFAEAIGQLRLVAQERPTLTAHDVRQKIGVTPKAASILGPVMQYGVKAGWIKPSGDWQESRYAVHHARPIRVFTSRLYGNPPGLATLAQSMPVKTGGPAIIDLVISDLLDRDEAGTKQYGDRLRPHNGRDALVDAYQEALDLANYLRQAIHERDGR